MAMHYVYVSEIQKFNERDFFSISLKQRYRIWRYNDAFFEISLYSHDTFVVFFR